MKFSYTAIFFLAASVLAQQAPPTPDPNGAANVGNGAGKQFITGACKSDADCGSGCCAGPNGICSGPAVGNANGKTGCGFGGAGGLAGGQGQSAAGGAAAQNKAVTGGQGNQAAAAAQPSGSPGAAAGGAAGGQAPPTPDASGDKNIGNGKGAQFITGACLSNADCGSGCCAGPNGICSGVAVGNAAGKTGCGFVSQKQRRAF